MATVQTVGGTVDVADLGVTLMHEHVFVLNPEHLHNYGDGGWWDEDAQVAAATEKLRRLGSLGVRTIVDPTVLGLGRDIARVQRVVAGLDLHVIVATGLYTYGDLPFVYSQRGPGTMLAGPDPMVADFIRDLTEGIGTTGVRAAFLKCAVEHAPASAGVERTLRAVADAHVATGAPITVHTSAREGTPPIALAVFEEHGVDLTKVVVAHAGDNTDVDTLKALADRGVTLGMDRFGLDLFATTEARVATIARLAADGYADRMVLSHDASCFIDWFGPEGPEMQALLTPNWHYEHISRDVLPALRAAGVTDAQVDEMLVANPRRYFGG